jgi:hypothetical protein
MASVMIGTGPHKASHTAVAVSGTEEPLGELRVPDPALPARAASSRNERVLRRSSTASAAVPTPREVPPKH